jgi:hypothetical protein
MCFDFSVNSRKNIEDGFLPYLSHDHLTVRVNMNNIESPANKGLTKGHPSYKTTPTTCHPFYKTTPIKGYPSYKITPTKGHPSYKTTPTKVMLLIRPLPPKATPLIISGKVSDALR